MEKLISKTKSVLTRDPHIIKYKGMYYRCFTDDSASVSVSCAKSIDGLKTADSKKVYITEENKEYSKELWAPELHIIDDKCYIYVACDDGNNHNHRMYVLTNHSNQPLNTYVMCGKISDESDKWAIDGTVMRYKGECYFIWSGWEGDSNVAQNLYIAKMKSPTELASARVMISAPEYAWEKLGSTGKEESPYINEGPYAFSMNGKQYLSYSAAGSWCEDYCIAILELDGEDVLNPKSWKKSAVPVLSSNDEVKGAGHCSIICEDDTVHVFFHAWDKNEQDVVWDTVSVWHGILKETDSGFIIE